jgi:hypothetical protein
LATSIINALNSVEIDITSAGTGTHTASDSTSRHAGSMTVNGQFEVATSTQLNGDLALLGTATLGFLAGPLHFAADSVDTPATITDSATYNDFSPGIGGTTVLRLQVSGSNTPTISSLTSGTANRWLWLTVTGGNDIATVTLTHDAGGTAANRFLLPGAIDLEIPQHGAVLLFYDGTASRWLLLGKNF